jgi:hypothetical protein
LWLLHKLKGNAQPGSDWLPIIVLGLWIATLIGINIYGFIVRKRQMQDKERQKWEKIRAKGKRRYVILGAVKVILLFLVMNSQSLSKAIDKGELFNITPLEAEAYAPIGLMLLIIIIGMPIANWDDQEKKYQESLK